MTFDEKIELLKQAELMNKEAILPALIAGGIGLGMLGKWGLERMGFTNPSSPTPAAQAASAVGGAAESLTNKTKTEGWGGSWNPFNTPNKTMNEVQKGGGSMRSSMPKMPSMPSMKTPTVASTSAPKAPTPSVPKMPGVGRVA